MSTPRQVKAAIKTAENIRNKKPKSIGVVLIESGYSVPVSKRPSTVTRSKGYKDALKPLLKRHNITIDRYLSNIDDAMKATKTIVHGKDSDEAWVDVVPDHSIRLAANKQAREFLHVPTDTKEPNDNTKLVEAINDNMDEIELQRIVFRKDEVPEPN